MALGWLRRFLGGGGDDDGTKPPRFSAETYNGYAITPDPIRKEGGWLTSGLIVKETAEGRKEHRFIRADTHTSEDEAARFSITKAKQIIDQQGERLFSGG